MKPNRRFCKISAPRRADSAPVTRLPLLLHRFRKDMRNPLHLNHNRRLFNRNLDQLLVMDSRHRRHRHRSLLMDSHSSPVLNNVAHAGKVQWDHQDRLAAMAQMVKTAKMAKMVPAAKTVNQWVVELALALEPLVKLVLLLVVHLVALRNRLEEEVTQLELELEPEPEPELVVLAVMDHHPHHLMDHPHHLMALLQLLMKIKNLLKNAQCNANLDHLVQMEEWVEKDHPDPKALPVPLEPMVNEANVVWLVTKLVLVHLANKDRKAPREMMANSTISMDPLDRQVHLEKTGLKDQ